MLFQVFSLKNVRISFFLLSSGNMHLCAREHTPFGKLGHSNSRITEEIYLHITKRLEEKQNEQIKDVKIL